MNQNSLIILDSYIEISEEERNVILAQMMTPHFVVCICFCILFQQELEAQNMFNTKALGEGEETFNNPVALKLKVHVWFCW